MTTLLDRLAGKTILLYAPHDPATLIRNARYLHVLNASARQILLVVAEPEPIRSLLEYSFDRLRVITVETAPQQGGDATFELEKLPLLFQTNACDIPFPYLNIPATPTSGKCRIGLALYGTEAANITTAVLARALPLQKLHHTTFTFFPAALHDNGTVPDCLDFCNAEAQDYAGLAEIISRLDMIIGFENDVTHLAGALGKPVWLLKSPHNQLDNHNFSNDYPLVSVFYKEVGRSWEQVLQDLFLYQTLNPSESLFVPFNATNMHIPCLPSDGLFPFPDLEIADTRQLQRLFELDVTDVESIAIETTTVCNLRCSYCPHSTPYAKAHAFMPDDIFYRIIDSLKEFRPDYSGVIIPSLYGEPLLDKRLETFIRYAKQKFPNATFQLFTNGSFLTIGRYKTLKEVGISKFIVSVHAPQMSEELCEILKTIQLEFSDLDSFEIISTYYANKYNRGGLVEGTPNDRNNCHRIVRCDFGYKNLVFDYEGNSVLCCNDYLSQVKFGNVVEESVKRIWDKAEYRRVRNKLLFGFLTQNICRVCLQHN